MKKLLAILLSLAVAAALCACGHQHSFTEADCTGPKTCTQCGETEGEAGEHQYVRGVCTVCAGAQEGYRALTEGRWCQDALVESGEELERIRLFFSEERTEITVSFWGAMWNEEIAGSYHGETVIVDGKEFVDMQFGTWAEMTYTEDGDTVQVEVTYHDEIRGSMTLTRTAADQYTVSGISGTVIDETITGAIRVGSVFTWKE